MTTIFDPLKTYKTYYTKTYLDSIDTGIYTYLASLGYSNGAATILTGDYLNGVLLGADQLEPDVILDAAGDPICFIGLNGCGTTQQSSLFWTQLEPIQIASDGTPSFGSPLPGTINSDIEDYHILMQALGYGGYTIDELTNGGAGTNTVSAATVMNGTTIKGHLVISDIIAEITPDVPVGYIVYLGDTPIYSQVVSGESDAGDAYSQTDFDYDPPTAQELEADFTITINNIGVNANYMATGDIKGKGIHSTDSSFNVEEGLYNNTIDTTSDLVVRVFVFIGDFNDADTNTGRLLNGTIDIYNPN